MAKRSTIGTNPLAGWMTPAAPEEQQQPGQQETPTGKGRKGKEQQQPEQKEKQEYLSKEVKERFTVNLPVSLIERVRNAVWWDRDTMAGFVEDALRREMEERERRRGEPYPAREGELKTGRPVK